MKSLFFLILLTPIYANAALECKDSAYGLDLVYTFTSTTSKDLELNAKTFMNGDLVIEHSGTATYSSTVEAQGNVLESYYIFKIGDDSYTELIAISKDLNTMGNSRPQPTSETGNFLLFTCSGTP